MSTGSMTCGDSPDANPFKISPSSTSLGIFVPRRSSSSFSITSFASSHQDSLSPRVTLLSVYRSCLQCSQTADERSEEHTSELQSRLHLVCRLLLEKKKSVH